MGMVRQIDSSEYLDIWVAGGAELGLDCVEVERRRRIHAIVIEVLYLFEFSGG